MKILDIEIKNLKGVTGRFPFTPLTIVTGANYAGKTAIADAIRIGLTGSHPDLPGTNAGVFTLASGETMSVEIATPAGGVRRTWTTRGKTVKATIEGDITIEAALLDPREFLRANQKTRLRMVADRSGEAIGAAVARVAEIVPGAKAETFEELEAYAMAAEKRLAEQRAIARRFSGMLEGTTIVDSESTIPEAIDLEAAEKAGQEAYARMRAAEATSEALDMQADRRTEALKRQRTDLPDMDIAVAAFSEANEMANTQRAHLDSLTPRLTAAIEAKRDADHRIAILKAKHPGLEDIDGVTAEIDRLNLLDAVTGDDVAAIASNVDQFNADLRRVEAQIASHTNQREAVNKELNDLDEMTCCPVCKASQDNWEVKAKEELTKRAADLSINLMSFDGQARTLRDKVAAATAALAEKKAIMADRAKLPGLEATLSAFMLYKGQLQQARDASTLIDSLDPAVSAARLTVVQAEEQARKAKATLDAVQARETVEIPAEVTEAEFEAAAMACQHARDELADAVDRSNAAKEAMRARAAAAEREANIRTAREQMDKATEEATKAETQAKGIRKIIAEEMEHAFAGIAAAGREFSDILDHELAVVEGEIGRYVSGKFVPFDAMSGTEQVVASIALQVGLQGGRQAFVLIDEVSRLDRIRKGRLAIVLIAAVEAGTIEQAVIIDHDKEFWNKVEAESPHFSLITRD